MLGTFGAHSDVFETTFDRPGRAIRMLSDVEALNIHRQMDVELNELAKQILMLLPLLLLLLLLLYVLYT